MVASLLILLGDVLPPIVDDASWRAAFVDRGTFLLSALLISGNCGEISRQLVMTRDKLAG